MPREKIKEVEIIRPCRVFRSRQDLSKRDGRPQGREVIRFSFLNDHPTFSVVRELKGH